MSAAELLAGLLEEQERVYRERHRLAQRAEALRAAITALRLGQSVARVLAQLAEDGVEVAA